MLQDPDFFFILVPLFPWRIIDTSDKVWRLSVVEKDRNASCVGPPMYSSPLSLTTLFLGSPADRL